MINSSISFQEKVFHFEKYKVIRKIGKGANGIVYEGVDILLNRKVAIKLWFNPVRSQNEIIKLANLNHRLVVKVYEFYIDQNVPICIMEYAGQINGKQFLKRKLDYFEPFALWFYYSKAMKYVHQEGFAHGDPHLGNIFILDFEKPRKSQHINQEMVRPINFIAQIGDVGTSKFLNPKTDKTQREIKIIKEVFLKIFKQTIPIELVYLNSLDHTPLVHLKVLDLLAKIFYTVECHLILKDRKSNSNDPDEKLDYFIKMHKGMIENHISLGFYGGIFNYSELIDFLSRKNVIDQVDSKKLQNEFERTFEFEEFSSLSSDNVDGKMEQMRNRSEYYSQN